MTKQQIACLPLLCGWYWYELNKDWILKSERQIKFPFSFYFIIIQNYFQSWISYEYGITIKTFSSNTKKKRWTKRCSEIFFNCLLFIYLSNLFTVFLMIYYTRFFNILCASFYFLLYHWILRYLHRISYTWSTWMG